MKKPLFFVALALILGVLCTLLWMVVQPVMETDTLKVTWHSGGGKSGVAAGRFQDRAGHPLAQQRFTLWTADAHLPGQTDDAGRFSLVLINPTVTALEVPGSGVLKFGALAPSAQDGLSLTVIVK